MTVDGLVSGAEAVAEILKGWRRHGRIAEVGMPGHIGRQAGGDIAAGRGNALVIGTLGDLGIGGGWRRRLIGDGLRMGTSRQSQGQRHDGYSQSFSHMVPRGCGLIARPACGTALPLWNTAREKVLHKAHISSLFCR